MKNFQFVYVLLNALINVPMVGFFNKEIDFCSKQNSVFVTLDNYTVLEFYFVKNKHWKSSNGKYAIWFDESEQEHKKWNIGSSKDYGTSSCFMYSIGQDNEEHSTPIGKSWMRLNFEDGNFVEDREIRVENVPGKS